MRGIAARSPATVLRHALLDVKGREAAVRQRQRLDELRVRDFVGPERRRRRRRRRHAAWEGVDGEALELGPAQG